MRSDARGWIQELKLRFECLARHIFRPGVAKGGEIDSVLNRIPVEVFLVESPATLLGVITSDVVPAELDPQRGGEQRIRRKTDLRLALDRRAGSRVVDDGIEHAGRPFGREIALPLDDLVAIAIEDPGRRPAVVLIAIGQIRA